MKIQLFSIMLLLSFGATALAQEAAAEGGSTGVGSGGETVNVGGKHVPRDLFDPTTCSWYPGSEFMDQLEFMPTILRAIENVHWYFADSLRREGGALSVCLLGSQLKRVNTTDRDTVALATVKGEQAAVRIDNQIFIDRKIFEGMDKEQKAYLYLHEITHSYVAKDTPRRNTKVRSFVAAMAEHVRKPMSADRFALQLEENSLDFPSRMTPKIERLKVLIMKALDPKSDRHSSRVAARELFEKRFLLGHNDSDAIEALLFKMDSNFLTAMVEGNLEGVRQAIEDGEPTNKRMPSMLALGGKFLPYPTDASGLFPLEYAISHSFHREDDGKLHPELAKMLILLPQVNPNFAGVGEPMPLHYAIGWDDVEFLKSLLARPDLDVNRLGNPSHAKESVLAEAVEQGDPRIVSMLIDDPRMDLNAGDPLPLNVAISRDRLDMFQLLINSKRIDFNRYVRGFTPLHEAMFTCVNSYSSQYGRMKHDHLYEMVDILVNDPRIDLNAPIKNQDSDRYMQTAEQMVEGKSGCKDILQLLKDARKVGGGK